MKVRVGTDLVRISRVASLSPAARSKVFHASERRGATNEHLANVLALKECCKKIFGPRMAWKSVEVRRLPGGAPQVVLSSVLQRNIQTITASASHEGDYALAFVVVVLR